MADELAVTPVFTDPLDVAPRLAELGLTEAVLLDAVGYAAILRHGEIGTGMNDYPAIFQTLSEAGFTGWISIEDGMNGLDEIRRSAEYLRQTVHLVDGT